MLRIELDAAGIPYGVEGPDGPLYADFHALRHTYLTLGGRAGIDLRTLQELAGHSSPLLTARYSHRRLYDLAGAVGMLPDFPPSGRSESEADALRATGTDAASAAPSAISLRPACAQTEEKGLRLMTNEETAMSNVVSRGLPQGSDLQGLDDGCRRLMTIEERVGEGTRTPDIQIHSLTTTIHNPPTAPDTCVEAPGLVAQKLPNDPDFTRLSAAWPDLPEPIRRAILALIDAAASGG